MHGQLLLIIEKTYTDNYEVSIYSGLNFALTLAQLLNIELPSPNNENLASSHFDEIKKCSKLTG